METCPEHSCVLSSFLGLFILDAISVLTAMTTKDVSSYCQLYCGGQKSLLDENHRESPQDPNQNPNGTFLDSNVRHGGACLNLCTREAEATVF